MPLDATKQVTTSSVEVPPNSIWVKLVTVNAKDLHRVEEAIKNAVGASAEVDRACRRNMSPKAVGARLAIADAAARGLVKVLAEVLA
jgi:hypothetical protein